MGVPSFFRWLRSHYPLILSRCIETEDDDDPNMPNQNTIGDKEFDNLYLDMNGLIHPCFHPSNGEYPETLDEVYFNVERYVDRIFNLVRPRKVLYLAVDGVAPRSKMNQQRLRRFRAAKEAEFSRYQKTYDQSTSEEEIKQINDIETIHRKDSNTITPGTEFMLHLSEYIKEMIERKRRDSPAWKNITVIFSDASVPGEGEHKIMEFIRSQRLEYGYDPTTRHCVYGLDADFLFLGLACHEVYFTILREEVFDIEGLSAPGERFGPAKFLFANGWVFRQYLEKDLKPNNIKFDWNFERALDDIIFVCFCVGNDFLPGLPGVKVQIGAVQTMIEKYKEILAELGGYITENGIVDSVRAAKFLSSLAKKLEQSGLDTIVHPGEVSRNASEAVNKRTLGDYSLETPVIRANIVPPIVLQNSESTGAEKYKYWKDKFGYDIDTEKDKILDVVKEYLKGMSWTLQYYLHGCPSWDWYYPFYYAPCLSDFALVTEQIDVSTFELGKPVQPLIQLMSVLPPQSSHLLPPKMADLMKHELSQFYPLTFEVDMLGENQTWKGVAKIPFVDIAEIERAVSSTDLQLTAIENERNKEGIPLAYFDIPAENQETKIGDSFLVDGPQIWGEFTRLSEDSYSMALRIPPKEQNVSFIPMNVEFPKNIVAPHFFSDRKVDIPLSIPGIPVSIRNATEDYRKMKAEEVQERKHNAQNLSFKKKKKLSFLK